MKRYVIAILFTCAVAYAQSPLALQYPFGLPDMTVAGPSAAMGGSGIAVAEEYFGAAVNPANAAIGGRSAFSALVTFDRTSVYDNDNTSAVSRYSPKLLSLVLPMGAAGNLGFAMQRRYDANLNYYTQKTLPATDDIRTQTNTIEIQNAGGLTAWQAGWAYRFQNGLGLGLAYERLFYNHSSRNVFKSEFRYDVSAPASFATSTQEQTNSAFASDGIRFGMQVPVHEKVTLAAVGEYVFKSDNGTVKREYLRSDASAALEETSGGFETQLPTSMNIGAAYTPDERWLIAVDAQSAFWGMYENDATHMFGDPVDLRQTYGVSVGGRFIPAVSRLSAKYWEKTLYSAGIKYNTLPRDESQELGFSLGVGLPIPNNGGLVDLVCEYGIRTDSRYSGYSENTLKFHLGINGGRDWFQDASKR